MKVLIGRNVLFEGLQRVFSVVPQKPTLPVLTNYLLNISEGRLKISGTDMDISITTELDCTVEGEGTVTVNAKRFLDIIREFPEGNVNITIEDERLVLDFKQGEQKIMGMASSNYPAIRESMDGVSISLDGDELVDIFDKTDSV